MWFLYIVRDKVDNLYTGVTTDIDRRINEHNRGKGGGYTQAHRPVRLVYQELYRSQSKALKREAQIKRWSRQKKLALINGNKALLTKLSKSRD